MQWIPLTEEKQLDEIIADSYHKPVAIYKHSTRCSVSVMVKRSLELEWNLSTEELPIYYLDLLIYRPISNKIASLLDVEHESPQLILVKDGKAAYYASQGDIDTEEVKSRAEFSG
jgi:bacillithiol system protein YtxJ